MKIKLLKNVDLIISIITLLGIFSSLIVSNKDNSDFILLYGVLTPCGLFLVIRLLRKLINFEFGSDQLAGISIITSVILGEYLAGSIVVLMLSGGEALERFAVKKASKALAALSKRMPTTAHIKIKETISDISIDKINVGDLIVIFPHETSPVDGEVVEGNSVMDESYLTGEPYKISKTPGSSVISGSINGHSVLTVKASKLPKDSRYSKIMEVMKKAEEEKPPIRRLGDKLGAWYAPLAIIIAVSAWIYSNDPVRFLAVLVVATPCPLLIGIPVAIIGAISLAAQRGIIIKDPLVLEIINSCDVMILDKTGTLTYGSPSVTHIEPLTSLSADSILQYAGSIEQYSKHPLAQSIINEMNNRNLKPLIVSEVSERPGEGLSGIIEGKKVIISNRKKILLREDLAKIKFPEAISGMECVVVIDNKEFGLIHFHDEPRSESSSFIAHLSPKHKFKRTMIVSGDRESEVQYLANKVGIKEVYSSQSPEQKVEHVKNASKHSKTLFIGDGINDAPALAIASVGIAFGQNSDVTAESAGAVIMESSLHRVDELFHISERMRAIINQSVLGGMGLSMIGMGFAAFGLLSPTMGALTQEAIDLFAVLNALRAAFPPKTLTDYKSLP